MATPIKARFTTKRHSRRPYIRLLVKDSAGQPFDFTGAASAKFVMFNSEGTSVVNSTAIIESPVTTGILRYEWKALDVAVAGEFKAEFDVMYDGGEIMTLPLDGNLLVTVYEDVNNA